MKHYFYVGGCTSPLVYFSGANSPGITGWSLDDASGELAPVTAAFSARNPTFLTAGENGVLYANCEDSARPEGAVSAYSIAEDGALSLLNTVSSQGSTTAQMALDRSGKYLLVVNYAWDADSGKNARGATEGRDQSLAVLPIGDDGSLGEAVSLQRHHGSGVVADRQARPHAHCVRASRDNRFVVVSDLGIDRLVIYSFDAATGATEAHGECALPPGSGPRHFVFSDDGRRLFLACELCSTVVAFAFERMSGELTVIGECRTVPADWVGESQCSEIALSPGGAQLYVANRGHDSLAVVDIDPVSGAPSLAATVATGGVTPRHFALSPDGRHLVLANQDSDRIEVFALTGDEGLQRLEGQGKALGSPTAICFIGGACD